MRAHYYSFERTAARLSNAEIVLIRFAPIADDGC